MTTTGWAQIGKMKRSHFIEQREAQSVLHTYILRSGCGEFVLVKSDPVELQQRAAPPLKACLRCAAQNPGAKVIGKVKS